MKRNVLSTTLSHIVVGLICYVSEIIIYGTFMSDSGELYEDKFTVLFCALAVIQMAGVVFLYGLAGYKFIKPAGSKIKTYISVWFLAVVLLALYIILILLDNKFPYISMYITLANPISYGIMLGSGYLSSNIRALDDSSLYHIIYLVFVYASFLIPAGGIWIGFRIKNRKLSGKASPSSPEEQGEPKQAETEREEIKGARRIEKAERRKAKRPATIKLFKIIALILAAATVLTIAFIFIIKPQFNFYKGKKALEAGSYTEAVSYFEKGLKYKKSVAKRNELVYDAGKKELADGDYEKAVYCFSEIQEYKDSIVLKSEAIYRAGKKALAAGEYSKAFGWLVQIPHYRDSDAICREKSFEFIPNVAVGDIVLYGKYEQDNVTENGKELIAWKVLDIKDNKALLLSEKCLDTKQYYDEKISSDSSLDKHFTWETCGLRHFLNNDFFISGFSETDQQAIETTTLINRVQAVSYVEMMDGGNNTQDKIFLLSIDEVEKYFPNHELRASEGTEYAMNIINEESRYVYYNDNVGVWWLRSPGMWVPDGYPTQASYVDNYGDIDDYNGVYFAYQGVRPAFWINLKADIFKNTD